MVGNYRSATERPEVLEANFEKQLAAGMMVKTTYGQAQEDYPGRLRVASLGALEQKEGEFRITHDGTHGARVNAAIRVRDQEACPTAHDLVAALDREILEREVLAPDAAVRPQSRLFALALDVSMAHRRVPIRRDDWGLQACSSLPLGVLPGPMDDVWVNTVGTYGIGSISYWWGRLGALLQRLLLYVVGPAGLLWVFRFADDFIWITGNRSGWRPLVLAMLLLRTLGVPIKWEKFRGGRQVDWIGYFFDLERCESGVSDKRSAWAADWRRRMSESVEIHLGDFRGGLGRLGFAAALLLYTKPFLDPLYA